MRICAGTWCARVCESLLLLLRVGWGRERRGGAETHPYAGYNSPICGPAGAERRPHCTNTTVCVTVRVKCGRVLRNLCIYCPVLRVEVRREEGKKRTDAVAVNCTIGAADEATRRRSCTSTAVCATVPVWCGGVRGNPCIYCPLLRVG